MPDLCKIEDVKMWLNLQNNSAADVLLARLITAVSADFLNAIGRTADFTPAAAYTDVHVINSDHLVMPYAPVSNWRGYGEFRLGLNHWPVNSIASVSIDGNAIAASADGIADGYFLDESEEPEYRNTLIVINQFVRCRSSRLSITYNAGYAANAIPTEIVQAAIEYVAFRYRVRDSLGKSQIHMQQGESITFDKDCMPSTVRDVIERYQRPASVNF